MAELAVEAERALDHDFPVAKGLIREDFRLGALLKVEVAAGDAIDVVGRQLTVFLAEVFAERLEPLGRVDELDLALAVVGLAVGQHPDVGGDAGVIEEVERQGDDGLEPVVFDDPAADIALALTRVAGEEGESVEVALCEFRRIQDFVFRVAFCQIGLHQPSRPINSLATTIITMSATG